jgi:hypothetical protein
MQEQTTVSWEFIEDMPLNPADRAWVNEAIEDAHKRHGFGKFTGFIKDWSGVGAAAGILVLVFTQWTGYIEFRTKTGDRLDTIQNTDLPALSKKLDALEGSLDKLTLMVTPQQIKRHAGLSKQEFQSTLPQLRAALQLATQEKIELPHTVVDDLQHKLLETERDAPEFWPTVSEFISYRSFNLVPKQAADLSVANLPNCTTSEPHGMAIAAVSPGGQVTKVSNAYYENCRFTIDSPEDDKRIMFLIKRCPTPSPMIEFRHCLIVYRGGDFTLPTWTKYQNLPAQGGSGTGLTLSYNGPTLIFTGCLFDFSASNQLPEHGQEITQSLLAQTNLTLVLRLREPSRPTHN